MSLSAGSITVNQTTGAISGSGLSFAMLSALFADPGWAAVLATFKPAALVQTANGWSTICQAFANAVVAQLQSNAVVTVPLATNQLASGVPSAPTNLTGGIT